MYRSTLLVKSNFPTPYNEDLNKTFSTVKRYNKSFNILTNFFGVVLRNFMEFLSTP